MPALSVIVKGDASPFEAELRRTQALTNKFATSMGEGFVQNMSRSMARGGKGGAFGGRFGVAGSMFTSVARDSAASLASGAPITQVIAQQAPQVLQALTMMRLGMVALRFSIVAAAVGGVAYMANEWRKMYFEVERTSKLNDKIKTFNENVIRWRDTARQRSTNEAQSAVAAFERNQAAIKQTENIADAELDLEKERVRAHSFQTQKVRTLEVEKQLQKELLELDLKRAQAALAAAMSNPGNVDVLKAQARLKEIETEGERQATIDDANTNWRTTTLRGAALADALKQKEDNGIAYAQKYSEAQKDLEAARAKSNAPDILLANAAVLRAQNGLDELLTRTDQKVSGGGSRRGSAPDVTDRQRMNLMAVGNSPLLDVNRQQLAYLKSIDSKMRRGNSIDAHFGSP